SKGNKVYYNGGDVGGQYVFTYPAPATVSVLEAEGEGLTWPTNTAVGASLTMPVPKSKNHRLSGEILLSNDNEESFSGLQAVAQSSLLATVTGSWDEMIIAEDGTVSGNIAGCVISSGAVTNYVASI